jgi:RNA polymerase sigma-70 factor (ECF subfamily)
MSAIVDQDAAAFEAHRRALVGLAYRMLGSRAEAEDAVQDAYLRWHAADRAAIRQPRRFLGTVVARLCLDRMKSAKARHETYVGQWLPDPVVDESFDVDAAGERSHDISVALMLLLERLSPIERASFLLHDVFGLDFADVARALSRNEPACRQLAARARTHIEAGRPRFAPSPEEGRRLAAAFQAAAASADPKALVRLALEHRAGRIVAIYLVRNPEKLQHVRCTGSRVLLQLVRATDVNGQGRVAMLEDRFKIEPVQTAADLENTA